MKKMERKRLKETPNKKSGPSGNCVPVLPLKTQKTHRETRILTQKAVKNRAHEHFLILKNLFASFRVFREIRVRARSLPFSSFFLFSVFLRLFCAPSGEIGTWIGTHFPEVPKKFSHEIPRNAVLRHYAEWLAFRENCIQDQRGLTGGPVFRPQRSLQPAEPGPWYRSDGSSSDRLSGSP